MNELEKMALLAKELDREGEYARAEIIDDALKIFVKSKKKWMQEAVNPKEKGELRKKMKATEGKEIPTSELEAKKKRLQEKAKGDKKLSKEDRETLSQVQFALNARRSKKKK